MARGRLIRPFLVDIARLDTAAIADDPDGAGPLTSGYDSDFREVVTLPSVDKVGTSARLEMALTRVRAQIETQSFLETQPMGNGNVPETRFDLVLHMQDLEEAGLVEAATGMVVFKSGDRVDAIYDLHGNLVQKLLNPPGLFVMEVMPASYGLGTARNLCVLSCRSRDTGAGNI